MKVTRKLTRMRRSLSLLLLSQGLNACYSLKQAYWFNNAFNGRITVAEALERDDLSQQERHKLRLSREIIKFAKEQGLNTGDSYQHFIPSGPGTVSYLVQAAYPDRLELLTWWFPVVGWVPYLGYFAKTDRDAKVLELQAQGVDISLTTVGAFSSLGWFSDPIYASMLRNDEENFIQMLLHELVHRSYWSPGSVEFNENLAEFISLKLTELYLKQHRAGQGLDQFLKRRQEREKLRVWLSELKAALQVNYARADLDAAAKLQEKSRIIALFREQRFPPLLTPDIRAAQKREWNNASILGASLYAPDTVAFERAWACLAIQDTQHFIAALKKVEHSSGQQVDALLSLCH